VRNFSVLTKTKSSAIAETAHVMIRSVIVADWLTLTITLNMTYANFYFTNNGVNTWNSSPSYVVSANMINCFKSKLDK